VAAARSTMATERLAVPARPASRPEARPSARPAHKVETKAPLLSTPARAGLLLGASAAVYAVTLAGVSGLQAETSGANATARASGLDAVARARAANDQLEASLNQLDAATRRLVDEYGTTADQATAYQARLDALASLVAEVQGTAAALPARIQLPTVTLHGAIGGGSGRAATHARSGGSGVKP
jgi:hypothetical protein